MQGEVATKIAPQKSIHRFHTLDRFGALEPMGQVKAEAGDVLARNGQYEKEKVDGKDAQKPAQNINVIRLPFAIDQHEYDESADAHEAVHRKNSEEIGRIYVGSENNDVAEYHRQCQVAPQSLNGGKLMRNGFTVHRLFQCYEVLVNLVRNALGLSCVVQSCTQKKCSANVNFQKRGRAQGPFGLGITAVATGGTGPSTGSGLGRPGGA
jgi:hypothetical protein